MSCGGRGAVVAVVFFLMTEHTTVGLAQESTGPEAALRPHVRANAELDLPTLSRFMAHDADITSYLIGGRKYAGRPEFGHDRHEKVSSVVTREIPILALTVWTKGPLAWLTLARDDLRVAGEGPDQRKTVLPLRERGILEPRAGQWVLLSWHESLRTLPLGAPVAQHLTTPSPQHLLSNAHLSSIPDLRGEWAILDVEDDTRYHATLEKTGNGP